MYLSTTVQTAQEAASLALEQLRVILAFVRDNAAWIGDRWNDLIRAMKVTALDLLIALLDDGSDAAAIPASATSENALVVEATVAEDNHASIENVAAVVEATITTDDHAIVESESFNTSESTESVASIAHDAGEIHVDTTTATATATAAPVARRCVLVVSTWTKAAIGAAGTAACYQSLDILRDLRIPVELRELDSVVHRAEFLRYKWLAQNAHFPQFFLEDAGARANGVHLPHDDLEEMNHLNGGEQHHELTDKELDEWSVPLNHRANHVFKGVTKHKIGVYHPEDIQAARDRLDLAERQKKALEEGASEQDLIDSLVLEQLKNERVKTRRSQKKKKKIQRVKKTALGEETK